MKDNQLTLFDRSQIPQKEVTSLTCATCVHIQKWECGGRVLRYCGKLKDRSTHNGLKRIRVKDAACTQHEPRSQGSQSGQSENVGEPAKP